MKRIKTRELQQKLFDILKRLPVVITKWGNDKYIVFPFDQRLIDYWDEINKR